MSSEYEPSIVGHILHAFFLSLHIYYIARYYWFLAKLRFPATKEMIRINITPEPVEVADSLCAMVAALFCVWLLKKSKHEEKKSKLWVIPFALSLSHILLSLFYYQYTTFVNWLYFAYHLATLLLLLGRDSGKFSGLLLLSGFLLPYRRCSVGDAQ